jgi:hypothetical protein
MHKSATKCNETLGKWCKNKHGASKIIDTLETYQGTAVESSSASRNLSTPPSSSTLLTEKIGPPLITQVCPLKGKDLHPACLILYCWYSWSCYKGGAEEIWLRWKRRRVLVYARGGDGICVKSYVYISPWPPSPYMGGEVSGSGPSQLQVIANPN